MNKKGQVLVVFVLILPLITLFLGLIIDIGNSLVIRKKYENIIKDVILYNYKDYKTEEESNEGLIIDEPLEEGETSDDNDLDNEQEPIIEEVVNETKEVDLNLIEKNIKESIQDYDEINLEVVEGILVVKLKAHYKSIFSSVFNIGLNTINIEIKYDIENKKIVRE